MPSPVRKLTLDVSTPELALKTSKNCLNVKNFLKDLAANKSSEKEPDNEADRLVFRTEIDKLVQWSNLFLGLSVLANLFTKLESLSGSKIVQMTQDFDKIAEQFESDEIMRDTSIEFWNSFLESGGVEFVPDAALVGVVDVDIADAE